MDTPQPDLDPLRQPSGLLSCSEEPKQKLWKCPNSTWSVSQTLSLQQAETQTRGRGPGVSTRKAPPKRWSRENKKVHPSCLLFPHAEAWQIKMHQVFTSAKHWPSHPFIPTTREQQSGERYVNAQNLFLRPTRSWGRIHGTNWVSGALVGPCPWLPRPTHCPVFVLQPTGDLPAHHQSCPLVTRSPHPSPSPPQSH